MNAFVFSLKTGNTFCGGLLLVPRRTILLPVLLLLIFVCQQIAVGQSDDFNDGDDIGWVRYDPFGTATFSFPNDDFGGKAYRVQSAASPNASFGSGRASGFRTNIYDDFYAAVDLAAWDNTLDQAFGLIFRARNIGPGTTFGYVLNYDPQQSAGGRGQLQINTVANESPVDPTLATANLTLQPGRLYRLVLTAVGSDFTAQMYDLNDLTFPLVSFRGNDPVYLNGNVGLFNFYRGTLITDPNAGRADSTFDNYSASAFAPVSVASPGTPHPIPHMPQVVDRLPRTDANNFYAYSNGISFTATTLTTNVINTNAIRLYLNGADVSSGLATSGTASNLSVTFNGLTSNTVYDARIVLADFAGRVSTNEFTFDTFDESFLDSPGVKVIEAEDYNYNSGQFQDNPPPAGYYGVVGAPAIDYFDRSTSAGSGAAPEYRATDFVGTQAGTAEEIDIGPGSPVINDTIRQKYALLDLFEYQVRRTEGGEWMNYTRVFSNASYNVYLRVACRAPQVVSLDKVTSDPSQINQSTASLGVFNVPSTGMLLNYRYVPLTDANGALAAVNVSGTNTVRLTLGGPQTNVTQYTMALNYLVFVPVTVPEIALLSSSDVAGSFTADNSATIDTPSRTITVPLNGNARFYRLRTVAAPGLAIRNVRIVGANVVMNYQ
ncbi:MAG: hypothetical protein DME26_13060 [Verrucomicrobia bacterium]|nr:MAG: hypothetical protein DME26_13060 [Verrucomicrobiota bacterium]